eukprot:gnl/Chilomastix_cuspidata/2192.p1 GENE.gnl/Chilomastix_cuspidata/2192~~gnl/Chilomastix_cuspidata/2192.p1  ORF type:complete len:2553 (+),score=826.94 gnl/Chilomastix_cuspidata/2192:35-7693(+)
MESDRDPFQDSSSQASAAGGAHNITSHARNAPDPANASRPPIHPISFPLNSNKTSVNPMIQFLGNGPNIPTVRPKRKCRWNLTLASAIIITILALFPLVYIISVLVGYMLLPSTITLSDSVSLGAQLLIGEDALASSSTVAIQANARGAALAVPASGQLSSEMVARVFLGEHEAMSWNASASGGAVSSSFSVPVRLDDLAVATLRAADLTFATAITIDASDGVDLDSIGTPEKISANEIHLTPDSSGTAAVALEGTASLVFSGSGGSGDIGWDGAAVMIGAGVAIEGGSVTFTTPVQTQGVVTAGGVEIAADATVSASGQLSVDAGFATVSVSNRLDAPELLLGETRIASEGSTCLLSSSAASASFLFDQDALVIPDAAALAVGDLLTISHAAGTGTVSSSESLVLAADGHNVVFSGAVQLGSMEFVGGMALDSAISAAGGTLLLDFDEVVVEATKVTVSDQLSVTSALVQGADESFLQFSAGGIAFSDTLMISNSVTVLEGNAVEFADLLRVGNSFDLQLDATVAVTDAAETLTFAADDVSVPDDQQFSFAAGKVAFGPGPVISTTEETLTFDPQGSYTEFSPGFKTSAAQLGDILFSGHAISHVNFGVSGEDATLTMTGGSLSSGVTVTGVATVAGISIGGAEVAGNSITGVTELWSTNEVIEIVGGLAIDGLEIISDPTQFATSSDLTLSGVSVSISAVSLGGTALDRGLVSVPGDAAGPFTISYTGSTGTASLLKVDDLSELLFIEENSFTFSGAASLSDISAKMPVSTTADVTAQAAAIGTLDLETMKSTSSDTFFISASGASASVQTSGVLSFEHGVSLGAMALGTAGEIETPGDLLLDAPAVQVSGALKVADTTDALAQTLTLAPEEISSSFQTLTVAPATFVSAQFGATAISASTITSSGPVYLQAPLETPGWAFTGHTITGPEGFSVTGIDVDYAMCDDAFPDVTACADWTMTATELHVEETLTVSPYVLGEAGLTSTDADIVFASAVVCPDCAVSQVSKLTVGSITLEGSGVTSASSTLHLDVPTLSIAAAAFTDTDISGNTITTVSGSTADTFTILTPSFSVAETQWIEAATLVIDGSIIGNADGEVIVDPGDCFSTPAFNVVDGAIQPPDGSDTITFLSDVYVAGSLEASSLMSSTQDMDLSGFVTEAYGILRSSDDTDLIISSAATITGAEAIFHGDLYFSDTGTSITTSGVLEVSTLSADEVLLPATFSFGDFKLSGTTLSSTATPEENLAVTASQITVSGDVLAGGVLFASGSLITTESGTDSVQVPEDTTIGLFSSTVLAQIPSPTCTVNFYTEDDGWARTAIEATSGIAADDLVVEGTFAGTSGTVGSLTLSSTGISSSSALTISADALSVSDTTDGLTVSRRLEVGSVALEGSGLELSEFSSDVLFSHPVTYESLTLAPSGSSTTIQSSDPLVFSVGSGLYVSIPSLVIGTLTLSDDQISGTPIFNASSVETGGVTLSTSEIASDDLAFGFSLVTAPKLTTDEMEATTFTFTGGATQVSGNTITSDALTLDVDTLTFTSDVYAHELVFSSGVSLRVDDDAVFTAPSLTFDTMLVVDELDIGALSVTTSGFETSHTPTSGNPALVLPALTTSVSSEICGVTFDTSTASINSAYSSFTVQGIDISTGTFAFNSDFTIAADKITFDQLVTIDGSLCFNNLELTGTFALGSSTIAASGTTVDAIEGCEEVIADEYTILDSGGTAQFKVYLDGTDITLSALTAAGHISFIENSSEESPFSMSVVAAGADPDVAAEHGLFSAGGVEIISDSGAETLIRMNSIIGSLSLAEGYVTAPELATDSLGVDTEQLVIEASTVEFPLAAGKSFIVGSASSGVSLAGTTLTVPSGYTVQGSFALDASGVTFSSDTDSLSVSGTALTVDTLSVDAQTSFPQDLACDTLILETNDASKYITISSTAFSSSADTVDLNIQGLSSFDASSFILEASDGTQVPVASSASFPSILTASTKIGLLAPTRAVPISLEASGGVASLLMGDFRLDATTLSVGPSASISFQQPVRLTADSFSVGGTIYTNEVSVAGDLTLSPSSEVLELSGEVVVNGASSTLTLGASAIATDRGMVAVQGVSFENPVASDDLQFKISADELVIEAPALHFPSVTINSLFQTDLLSSVSVTIGDSAGLVVNGGTVGAAGIAGANSIDAAEYTCFALGASSDLVVSCPVSFNNHLRFESLAAPELAGFGVAVTFDEAKSAHSFSGGNVAFRSHTTTLNYLLPSDSSSQLAIAADSVTSSHDYMSAPSPDTLQFSKAVSVATPANATVLSFGSVSFADAATLALGPTLTLAWDDVAGEFNVDASSSLATPRLITQGLTLGAFDLALGSAGALEVLSGGVVANVSIDAAVLSVAEIHFNTTVTVDAHTLFGVTSSTVTIGGGFAELHFASLEVAAIECDTLAFAPETDGDFFCAGAIEATSTDTLSVLGADGVTEATVLEHTSTIQCTLLYSKVTCVTSSYCTDAASYMATLEDPGNEVLTFVLNCPFPNSVTLNLGGKFSVTLNAMENLEFVATSSIFLSSPTLTLVEIFP